MWDNMNVKGFQFDTAAEYAEAKHEAEAIEYICSKMDVNDPQIALKVYYKLLERKNLHTVFGVIFLKELRDRIINAGLAEDSDLKYIHAPSFESDLFNANETGDETALENDSLISEASEDVEDKLKGPELDKSDEVKKLNRDLSIYRDNEKKIKSVAEHYRKITKTCYVVIIALIVVIVCFFGIAYYNNNLSFKDKEIEVQDKYSAWAEELQQREYELDLREAELNNAK